MTDYHEQGLAETIFANCTTTIAVKFDFHKSEVGHSVVIGPTGKGMSVMLDALQDDMIEARGKIQIFDKGRSVK